MRDPQTQFDIIIIGGGAAGLMCAMEAAERKRSVLIIEHQDRIGKKIRISGGGRCNFTNLHAQPEHFVSENPHFCVSALARFTPDRFIALVNAHGIEWHEKKDGQLFCDGSTQQIIDMLRRECVGRSVVMETRCAVERVSRDDTFVVETSNGTRTCASLVIATGGLSIPTLGATSFGYRIAEQFGLKIIPPRAALVPFVCGGKDAEFFESLSGVSLPARVSTGPFSIRDDLLCTHRGMSGPAILQASLYWNPGQDLVIDLLPEYDLEEDIRSDGYKSPELATLLGRRLPTRFARAWCERFASSAPLTSLGKKQIREIDSLLHRWIVRPVGTEGYRTAEVTAGGVNTRELSSQTMEAHAVKGLYFIGEVVDVTGMLGGFNFQWAWSSGWVAGQYA